tara:strand:- start:10299 stop:10949 length:651 start_codon:yes stop_codon:yes gene_type:complete
MKNLPILFLGIFFTVAFSWSGLILSSQIQYGGLTPTTATLDEDGNPTPGETLFPRMASGQAEQGKLIYIREGCMYCHTQQVRPQGFGADYERGWGPRQTVPRDYILQDRVLLGTMRTGPDLADVGGRPLTRSWHHQHLYNPQITSPGSIMPPFAYLYEVKEIEGAPSPNAVTISPDTEYAPEPGFEVVPTKEAEVLVDYLLSLKVDYELPEAKFTE